VAVTMRRAILCTCMLVACRNAEVYPSIEERYGTKWWAPARQCHCDLPDNYGSVRNADLLAVGTILSYAKDVHLPLYSHEGFYTARLDTVWRMSAGISTQVVVTAPDDAPCLRQFTVGERYLLALRADEQHGFVADVCSFTQPFDEVHDYDLDYIGPAFHVQEVGNGFWSWHLLAALVAASFASALIGAVAARWYTTMASTARSSHLNAQWSRRVDLRVRVAGKPEHGTSPHSRAFQAKAR
jgi:hypothetical protein